MSYVPFAPLKYDGQKGLITAQINKGFYKDLAQVLVYYEVPYRKEAGVINIRRKLSQDKDLVWNYTSKALNEDWLKTHTHH
jgi:hypothetical protein